MCARAPFENISLKKMDKIALTDLDYLKKRKKKKKKKKKKRNNNNKQLVTRQVLLRAYETNWPTYRLFIESCRERKEKKKKETILLEFT